MILQKVLGGGVDLAVQLQHFYRGLNYNSQHQFDIIAGGSVWTKSTHKIIVLFTKVSSNAHTWRKTCKLELLDMSMKVDEVVGIEIEEDNLGNELVRLSNKESIDDHSDTFDLEDKMEEEMEEKVTRNHLERIYRID
ncbi:hypothetical protein EPI10_011757 [Gossypium australe]|uniref:Uncharacterized protein n=1 Tax=Gossypium australe TaxID=47621 RepID=A0A5B6W994_9ROSI|nr:hypothetical protein EPI10_011757 [Gossypium australe]